MYLQLVVDYAANVLGHHRAVPVEWKIVGDRSSTISFAASRLDASLPSGSRLLGFNKDAKASVLTIFSMYCE
jgi:hypothetical protein